MRGAAATLDAAGGRRENGRPAVRPASRIPRPAMPVQVACPDCAASLKAPDRARGKALKCPKCGGRVPVPAAAAAPAKSRAKAGAGAAKAGDPGTGEFLAGIDLSRVEDTSADVCPKCGTEVFEEDVECPKCGADLVTGGKGLSQRRKAKFKHRGEDPKVFYGKAPGDAWQFLMKNKDVAVRLGVLASFAAVSAAGCGLMMKYCAFVPPKMFWGGLAVIGVLFLPGCLWVLQEAVTELTFRGKNKFKRFRFDTLLCVSRGPRVAAWALVALFPLTILDLAAWAGVAALGMPPVILYAALAVHAVCAFLCWPAGLGHMAMPVSSPGWNFAKVAGGTAANLGPVLLWAGLTLAAFLPFLGVIGGVAAVAGANVAGAVGTLDQNAARARAAAADESRGGSPIEYESVDWNAFIVPAAAVVPAAFLFAFGAVYAARPAGLLAKTFRPSLGLITMTKEKKYVSTTRKKDEFGDFIDGEDDDALTGKTVGLILAANLGLGLIVGAIGSFSFEGYGPVQGAGLGVVFLGFLFSLGARFAFTQQVHEAGFLWKIVCMIPLGEFVFTALHFEDAKYPFFWEIGCFVLMVVGLGIAAAGGLDVAEFLGSVLPE